MRDNKKKKFLAGISLVLCLLILGICFTGSVSGQKKAVLENPIKGISSDRSQVVYRGKGFYSPVVSGDNETDTQYLNTEVLIQDQESENQDSDSEDQENQNAEDLFSDDGSESDGQADGSGENSEETAMSDQEDTGAEKTDTPVTTKFEDSDTETADHADGSDDDRNQAGALAPEPTEIPQETPEVEDLRPTISSDLTDGETIHKESRVFSVYAEDYKERVLTPSQLTVTCNGEKLSSISTDNGVIRYKAYLNESNEISITATDRYGNTDTVSVTVYKEINGNEEEEEQPAGTITFSLEGSTIGLGNIIGPTEVPFYEEETLPYVLNRVLYSAGCQYHFTGSMDAGFYLKSVDRTGITSGYEIPAQIEEHLEEVNDIPDPDTCSPDWLGEGTLTGGSGWMFSVNGVYLSSGMNTYFPADGDEIRVRFTLYYGADIGEAMLGGETWGDW